MTDRWVLFSTFDAGAKRARHGMMGWRDRAASNEGEPRCIDDGPLPLPSRWSSARCPRRRLDRACGRRQAARPGDARAVRVPTGDQRPGPAAAPLHDRRREHRRRPVPAVRLRRGRAAEVGDDPVRPPAGQADDGTWVERDTTATMTWGGDGHNHWHVHGYQRSRSSASAAPRWATSRRPGSASSTATATPRTSRAKYTTDVDICQPAPNGRSRWAARKWGDIYRSNIAFQWIDITGLAERRLQGQGDRRPAVRDRRPVPRVERLEQQVAGPRSGSSGRQRHDPLAQGESRRPGRHLTAPVAERQGPRPARSRSAMACVTMAAR